MENASRLVLRVGLAATALLVVAYIVTRLGTDADRMFDLDEEANVPTWVAATLLLTGGLGGIVAGRVWRDRGVLLAGVALVWLSADETTTSHELLGAWAQHLPRLADVSERVLWPVAYLPIALAVAAALAAVALRHPAPGQRRRIRVGLLLLLVVPAIEALSTRFEGESVPAGEVLLVLAEESVELVGFTLLAAALVALAERAVSDGSPPVPGPGPVGALGALARLLVRG